MTACGDEIQIAADTGLRRMDITQIVRTVDDPELLVAGGEVENLLILGKNNERRKAELGPNGDDIFLRVLHDPRGRFRCGVGGRSVEDACAQS